MNVRLVRAVPWLRLLRVGLAQRRSGFDPRSVHVKLVGDNVAIGRVLLLVLRFFPCLYHASNVLTKPSKEQHTFGNRGELSRKILPLFQPRVMWYATQPTQLADGVCYDL
jgi:hypothetical protein